MVLLAQIVNDEFQRSIQEMFAIDKVTNEGVIEFNNLFGFDEGKETNDNIGDGKIVYMRGLFMCIQ